MRYFAIPAIIDMFNVGLMNVALTILVASVHQMLKGGTILATALMGKVFLKRQLSSHNWISMSMIFIGLFIIGQVDPTFSREELLSFAIVAMA